MRGVVADTHALLWYLANSPSLSAIGRAAMVEAIHTGGGVVVASITLVEVAYLIEKGRVDSASFDLIMRTFDNPSSVFCLAPLDQSVAECLRRVPRHDVPDMPDRIIAATALQRGFPVISRDRKIKASAIQTIW